MRIQTKITRESSVEQTARLIQVRGIQELPAAEVETLTWDLDFVLPDAWSVGAIVGDSGSGKSTVGRELARLFGTRLIENRDAAGKLCEPFDWPANQCICDGFPKSMSVRDMPGLLTSVGFGSAPAWTRPYGALSEGQKFRTNLARSLAEAQEAAKAGNRRPVFFDEFASLVHDKVAETASIAVSNAAERMDQQFVAVTWRTDILNPLKPDWVLFMRPDQTWEFKLNQESKDSGRSLWRREPITIRIFRTARSDWSRFFAAHHYLSADIHDDAACYGAETADGRIPVGFVAVMHFPNREGLTYREHRLVVLPDWQGVGIGNQISEAVASLYTGAGHPYFSTTGHPAMISHRTKSPRWNIVRKTSLTGRRQDGFHDGQQYLRPTSGDRMSAGFQYIGPARTDEAAKFGLLKSP